MANHRDKDPAVRLLALLAVTTFFWATTYLASTTRLTRGDHTLPLRILLVSLAIVGFLSWVYVAGRSIFAQDEFTQRIHLIAIAITFAVTGVASFASDFLQKAGFVPELPFSSVWMFMVVLWWISIMSTSWYYR